MRNRLQVTADAAALAGAPQLEFLPDQSTIVPEARNYADRNMSIAAYGEVLAAQDVVVGNWEPDTRTFTAGLDPLNAVMTKTRQQEASGNAVPAFLGGIRSEEHTSELQSLLRISYAVFCLKTKTQITQ